MSDMSNYFEIAEQQGGVLLDASNFPLDVYPIMTHVRNTFMDIAQGKFELGYDNPGGSYTLRELIADHESHLEGISLNRSNVAVSSGGVTGAFDNIFRYLARIYESSSEVIIPIPAYPEIERAVSYNGLTPVRVDTTYENGFQPTLQDIAEKCNKKTACVFITSPGNPYSKRISEDTLLKIIGIAGKFGAYIVLDAIFEEANLNPSSQPFLSVSNYPRLIKIKGLSKDRPHMNDFRIGWSISKDYNIIHGLSLASEVAGFCVSKTIDALATSEMRLRVQTNTQDSRKTSSPEFKSYMEELSRFYSMINRGLELSDALLINHPAVEKYCIPDAGNLIFVQVKKEFAEKKGIITEDDLFLYLLESTGIGITPGHVFGTNPEELWFRVTMTKHPEYFKQQLEKVIEALR